MRFFIYAYYLLYVLSGGFRHYYFDYMFFNTLNSEPTFATPFIIPVGEVVMMLSAIVVLLLPHKKYLHLLFFLLVFVFDLYFQNQVNFMSCFTLPHVFPLFFFLFLHYQKKEKAYKLIAYAAMLTVAVGYLASFTSKVHSAWYNWSDPIIYSYILEFYSGFQVPSLLSGWLVSIKSLFFWKLLDYSVLVIQGSFILVFLKKKYFYIITPLAVLFHMGILVSLGIGVVFFLYILFYAFTIFMSANKPEALSNYDKALRIVVYAIVVAFLILFGVSKGDVRIFNSILPVSAYIYAEYLYGVICVVIYAFSYAFWKRSNKQLQLANI